MNKPPALMVAQATVTQLGKELAWFPLWWYSKGLSHTFLKLAHSVRTSVKFFGLDIWVKNWFVPMYGETSLTGRAISFLVRTFMILARGIAVMGWAVVALILALTYLAAPPLLVVALVYHVAGSVI